MCHMCLKCWNVDNADLKCRHEISQDKPEEMAAMTDGNSQSGFKDVFVW